MVDLEMVGGKAVEKAPPSFEHADAQLGGGTFLRARFHRRNNGEGPGGWWIVSSCTVEVAPNEVYRPDLVGWRRSVLPSRPSGRPIDTRPDWVCEIVSQSNAKTDMVDKLRVYQRAAVPHYWLVDPAAEILTVYRYGKETYELAMTAGRDEVVRAGPFESIPFPVGVFFGDEPSAHH